MTGSGDDLRGFAFQTKTVIRWARHVADTFPPHAWLARPEGAHNHAWWLLGHVVVSSDWAPAMTGAVGLLPPGYENLFGNGSKPRPEGEGYPDVEELAPWLDETLSRNLAMLESLDPARMGDPPAVAIPEEGRRVMTTRERYLFFQPVHLAYHLGQIEWIRNNLADGR